MSASAVARFLDVPRLEWKKVGLLLHKFTVGHVYLFHFITVRALLSSSNYFLVRYIDTLVCSYALVTASKAYDRNALEADSIVRFQNNNI